MYVGTSRSATQLLTSVRTESYNRSIVCIRTRKSVPTQGTFLTLKMEHSHPFLQFTTTGGMGNKRYRSRLSQLIAIKKGEQYAEIMSWIRISFTLLKSAIICLRCSWAIKRFLREVKNADIDIENVEGAIRSNYSFFSTFFA